MTSRATIGECAINRVPISTNQGFKNFVSFESVYTEFLYYLLSTQKQNFVSLCGGSTFLEIGKSQLAAAQIPLPPLPEQRAIAAALSDVDALLTALDRLIAKKRAVKTAAMQQLLTGRQRLPGFSGEWETARIDELADVDPESLGSNTPPDHEFRYVSLEDVDAGRLLGSSNHTFGTAPSRARLKISSGDVLLSTVRPNLKAHLLFTCNEEDWVCSTGFAVLRPKLGRSVAGFLFNHCMEGSVPEQIDALITGSNYPAINTRDVRALELAVPPTTEEQTAIAAVLSDMDAEIAALEARRDKTKQIKRGMMQELLTGRTRLVQTAAPAAMEDATAAPVRKHSWAFNEAVVIAMLANRFGSEPYPLGRKRYTKLAYLLHRHVEKQPEGYLKKAAGPYNPHMKYGGPEKIALNNGYVREAKAGKYAGFVGGEEIDQATSYFTRWYGEASLQWLEQFRYEKNDALGVLTTVDMAVRELRAGGRETSVAEVKRVLRESDEWRPKLERAEFSDLGIAAAIRRSAALFGEA